MKNNKYVKKVIMMLVMTVECQNCFVANLGPITQKGAIAYKNIKSPIYKISLILKKKSQTVRILTSELVMLSNQYLKIRNLFYSIVYVQFIRVHE